MSPSRCGVPGTGRPSVGLAVRRFPRSSPRVSRRPRTPSRFCAGSRVATPAPPDGRCGSVPAAPPRPGARSVAATARARTARANAASNGWKPSANRCCPSAITTGSSPCPPGSGRLYKTLFAAAAGTLLRFGRERLGVELGRTALLHTWGQTLVDHPHVHCLVTGGGLATAAAGTATWRGPQQQRYRFPVKAVAAMFAGKFIDLREALRRAGELILKGALASWPDDRVWAGILAGLRAKPWIVFAQGSVVGPEAGLEYLERYTHRVALANARVLAVTDSTVSFRYKDYR